MSYEDIWARAVLSYEDIWVRVVLRNAETSRKHEAEKKRSVVEIDDLMKGLGSVEVKKRVQAPESRGFGRPKL